MTLIASHVNNLALTLLRLYKAARVLSILMKVYNIPCHERGHINVTVTEFINLLLDIGRVIA
jgi:hypothetical protein